MHSIACAGLLVVLVCVLHGTLPTKQTGLSGARCQSFKCRAYRSVLNRANERETHPKAPKPAMFWAATYTLNACKSLQPFTISFLGAVGFVYIFFIFF